MVEDDHKECPQSRKYEEEFGEEEKKLSQIIEGKYYFNKREENLIYITKNI